MAVKDIQVFEAPFVLKRLFIFFHSELLNSANERCPLFSLLYLLELWINFLNIKGKLWSSRQNILVTLLPFCRSIFGHSVAIPPKHFWSLCCHSAKTFLVIVAIPPKHFWSLCCHPAKTCWVILLPSRQNILVTLLPSCQNILVTLLPIKVSFFQNK